MLYKALAFIFTILISFGATATNQNKTITVGSKRFTENYIIAEIFSQLIEHKLDQKVDRRFGLGGTMIAYNALKADEIQVYPEYTGTLAAAIVKTVERDFEKLNQFLQKENMIMLSPLGFDNSYTAIMKATRAKELGITSIGDLAKHPELQGAFSFEFQKREDGWPSLKRIYGLSNPVQGMDVPLTYEALKNDNIDFAEAYSTEPLIKKYDFDQLFRPNSTYLLQIFKIQKRSNPMCFYEICKF